MENSPSYLIARVVMEHAEMMIGPMHEWLAGERRYLREQGYTDDEARAMAAAGYVLMFGTTISRTQPPSAGTGE
jgi:hypothetical protein